MDQIKEEFQKEKRNSDVMESFGFRLWGQFESNKAYRRPKELEWIESLRQYKGLYDPEVKIEANASKVYPKLTRSKLNIVLSRLHEMLFPETDKNWEIDTTPEPKVSPAVVAAIVQALTQVDEQTGQAVPPSPEDLDLAIRAFAAATCEKMSSQIDDQLTEIDYPEETKKVLRSGLMYGTGLLKGPLVGKKQKRKWEPDQKGGYKERLDEEDYPDLKFTRLWDWYPDMTVTETENMQGSYERHVMNKHDLRELAKREDFYGDIILAYLKDMPDGDYVATTWENDLQLIEVEAGTGQSGKTMVAGTTNDTRSTYRKLGKRYEVLEFWGYVDGDDLEACGVHVEDPSLEYGANIWLLGKHVIKAMLFSTPLDQYKVFYYEKDETSIFGEGLARVMRHSQIAIAAAARMVLDNGSCCAGPQVEVNWSLMTPDTDLESFYPRKIWYREGRGVDAQYPAVRVYQIDSHIPELLEIVAAFKQFADEETTLPTWMISQMMNNETAQATSGRMATITISIKDVVKNFDAFTEKVIKDLYAWNMEFNPREDIKGDYSVRARGVSSLVMKELRMQALNQLATTITDSERDYIPEGDFLKERFKAHDIDIKLRSEEEVSKLRKEREESLQMQLAIKMQEAEIGYKKAQTMAQLTKAKDKNVEANIKAQTPIEQPEGSDPRLTEEDIATKQTERQSKEAENRRKEEKHALELSQKDEAHRVKIATEAARAESDIENKRKTTEHSLKMKEDLTKASAEAKKTAAKQKPAPKKASKGVK